MFGRESSGLTNAEVALANKVGDGTVLLARWGWQQGAGVGGLEGAWPPSRCSASSTRIARLPSGPAEGAEVAELPMQVLIDSAWRTCCRRF
jgi:hypothetical protein